MKTIGVVSLLLALAAPSPVLPFIEDDYNRALSEARGKSRLIFVEAWAPW